MGEKIDFSVFPSLQGGPHNHTIAALTVALGMCATNEYKVYQQQVMDNAQALSKALANRGFSIVSGGLLSVYFILAFCFPALASRILTLNMAKKISRHGQSLAAG